MRKKLTENFYEDEFRCPCCGEVKMDPVFIDKLQELRDELGFAIYITSEGGGYRCMKYQAENHPDHRSAHSLGKAADIKCSDSSHRYLLVNGLGDLDWFRFGVYDKHIHVDTGEEHEGFPQCVIWTGTSS